jgi:electron transfer flavoprotein beta subunit
VKIIVPIKQVPETSAVKVDETTGTVIREGVEAIVNPLDLYAIETAIQLREEHGGELTAISMGPPKAESALKEAISMGIDSGILISDKAFAGSDTWSTSYILSEAIKKTGDFDLIICGERATDGDTGQVGPGIASFLDLPVISYCSRIIGFEKNICQLHRMVETGYEVLQTELPAVLTVVKEIAIPRLPTLRGKQKAKKTDLTIWSIDDLDVNKDSIGLNGSPTRVVKIFRPKITRKCEMLTANDETSINTASDRIVSFLKEKELI